MPDFHKLALLCIFWLGTLTVLSLCSPCLLSITLESPAESESNLESNSDGSEDDAMERGVTEGDSDAEKAPLKLTKAHSAVQKSSPKISGKSSLHNLPIIKPPSLTGSLLTGPSVTSLVPLNDRSPLSTSFTLATPGMKSAVTLDLLLFFYTTGAVPPWG